jgi:hypothetical protein
MLPQEFGQGAGFKQIQSAEKVRGNVVPMTFRKVVDHRHVVTLFKQQVYGVRADVSGAPGNENLA